MNLAGFSFGTNEVRVFIHGVMQIPGILCCSLTEGGLLNRFIFYLFKYYHELLIKYPK